MYQARARLIRDVRFHDNILFSPSLSQITKIVFLRIEYHAIFFFFFLFSARLAVSFQLVDNDEICSCILFTFSSLLSDRTERQIYEYGAGENES